MPITYLPPIYNFTTYLPTNPPTHLPRCTTYLPTHPPTYLNVLRTYLPTHLPTYIPIHPLTYLFTYYLPTYILTMYLPSHPPRCTTYILAYLHTQLPCPTTYLPSWLAFYNLSLCTSNLLIECNFLCYLPSYLLNNCMLPTYL